MNKRNEKHADVNVSLNKFILLARDQHMLTVGIVNTINKNTKLRKIKNRLTYYCQNICGFY